MEAALKFIGHIKTPYETIEDCPNNVDLDGPTCQLIIREEYLNGLLGLQTCPLKRSIMVWFTLKDLIVSTELYC